MSPPTDEARRVRQPVSVRPGEPRGAAGAWCRCRSPRTAPHRRTGSARAHRRRATWRQRGPRPSTSIRRTCAPVTSCAPASMALRPVRDVGRALRTLVAARPARPALHARRGGRRARPTGSRRTRATSASRAERAREPARAQCARSASGGAAGRRRAGTPGCRRDREHAELPIGLLVERLQLLVRERPVIGDADVTVRVRKSDASRRGHTALYSTVPPPTPLKLPSAMSAVVEVDRVVAGRPRTFGDDDHCLRRGAPSRARHPGTATGPASLPAPGTRRGCRRGGAASAATPPDAPAPTMRTSARSLTEVLT